MALFCRDFVFNDHAAYIMALADALAEEYQQIAQHGLQLQVWKQSIFIFFGCSCILYHLKSQRDLKDGVIHTGLSLRFSQQPSFP